MARRPGVASKPLVKIPLDANQCWVWNGQHDELGYPRKQFNGQPVRAQRWLWETLFGSVPKDKVIFNDCGVKGCVNPQHMRMGTRSDACRNGEQGILLPGDVKDIFEAVKAGKTQTSLAEVYDVHVVTINDAVRQARGKKRVRKPKKETHEQARKVGT